MPHSRSRIVYYRVTEQEFDEMVRFCEEHEIRSVSDLSREALRQTLQRAKNDPQKRIYELLQEIRKEVSTLQKDIREVRGKLAILEHDHTT
jgi:hypothetical protein